MITLGIKKNATITITGVHNDFNVLLTASIKKVGTNAIVKLNYTLDPEKEIPNINYEIALQTEGEISLDQTTWHTTGKKLPVTKETHTIYYRNAISGDYNVVLKTTDSNGKDKNATTNIEVRDRPVLTEHKVSKWDKKDSMFGNTYHFLELTGFIYSLAKNTSLATLKFRFKRKNNSWTEWEILDWSKNKFRDYPNFIEFNSTNETIRLENHTKEESDFRFNKGAAIEFILVDSEGIESEVKAGTITW